MATIKLYLNGINDAEKTNMTKFLSFLHEPNDNESRERLTKIATRLYGGDIKLDLAWCGNHTAYESVARPRYNKSVQYYNIIKLGEHEVMTEPALSMLGKCLEWDWRYMYSIALCSEDRKLYVISYSNACQPNWNDNYDLKGCIALDEVDFQLLKDGCTISRIENNLHAAINDILYSDNDAFKVTADGVSMLIKDQHGNYMTLHGKSVEEVFRNYADNYVGYRNFRRPDVSEWKIVGEDAKANYNEWIKSAQGLKSDFDKFYGGGIVD